MGGLLPGIMSSAPPEVKKSGWSSLKSHDVAVADGYALGLLLHAVFNPDHPTPATAEPPHPPPPASSRGAIPLPIFPLFKKLLNPNPTARGSAKHFLDVGMTESGFFSGNRLVKVCLGLDNFAISSDGEKATFLRTLSDSATSFPSEFATHRLLPSLLSALEFGGASAAAIVPLVLQFGKDVTPEDYSSVILSPLVKLYASPDRGTRMALLDHLPSYIDKLDKKTVSDKIFPHLQTGFSDTVAVIREATVRSMTHFAPKLTDRLMNNDLLRLLAKMQMDPEPSIRTNTCILLGRLGPTLGYNTKRKVLVPAFSRALKDTFVHARVAGLMAFMATIECFEVEELATKVIPCMSFTLVDKEKFVSVELWLTIKLNGPRNTEMNTSSPATLVNSAAGAAGTLAGWAISSLGKKLAASDMQSTIASSSTPTPPGGLPSPAINGSSLSEQSRTASPAAQHNPPASKSKAMQLGMKSPGGLPSHSLADDLAEEIAASETANPWGTDDLIDVNADEDDWSAFETAPVSTPALQSPTLSTTSKPASFPTSRPTPKSPVPQVKVAHASFPGSFDTPISTPSSSRTPEPSWGGK
ncbi:hypothetical protein H1R20_g5851, partial [Candolleomyces eurysporus]